MRFLLPPPPPLLNARGGERPKRVREEGPGLIACCLILLSSSAQNNPVKKSFENQSFCLREVTSLPSTKIPHLRIQPRLRLVLLGRVLFGGKKGAVLCVPTRFSMVPFFSPVGGGDFFLFTSLHSSIHLFSVCGIVFVLIAGFGTLIR